jgi:hypothetical protein
LCNAPRFGVWITKPSKLAIIVNCTPLARHIIHQDRDIRSERQRGGWLMLFPNLRERLCDSPKWVNTRFRSCNTLRFCQSQWGVLGRAFIDIARRVWKGNGICELSRTRGKCGRGSWCRQERAQYSGTVRSFSISLRVYLDSLGGNSCSVWCPGPMRSVLLADE